MLTTKTSLKKKRKQRSDKGVKRGPRKKTPFKVERGQKLLPELMVPKLPFREIDPDILDYEIDDELLDDLYNDIDISNNDTESNFSRTMNSALTQIESGEYIINLDDFPEDVYIGEETARDVFDPSSLATFTQPSESNNSLEQDMLISANNTLTDQNLALEEEVVQLGDIVEAKQEQQLTQPITINVGTPKQLTQEEQEGYTHLGTMQQQPGFRQSQEEEEPGFPVMTHIEIPALILAVGKKKSGKSTFVKHYLRMEHEKFEMIYIISGTAKVTKEYDNIYPNSDLDIKVMNTLEKNVITDLLETRDRYSEPLLLIFDDFIGMRGLNIRGKEFSKLVSAGRHYNLTLILCSQQFKAVPPLVRNNAEYMMLFNVPNSEVKQIYEVYGADTTLKNFIQTTRQIISKKGWFKCYNLDMQIWFLGHVMKF